MTPFDTLASQASTATVGVVYAKANGSEFGAVRELGGLRLLDRAVLNLAAAGIERIVVIGSDDNTLHDLRHHRDLIGKSLVSAGLSGPDETSAETIVGETSDVIVVADDMVLDRNLVRHFRASQPVAPTTAGDADDPAVLFAPCTTLSRLTECADDPHPLVCLAKAMRAANGASASGSVVARVNNRASARRAESALLQSLKKPTDGIVSKVLNRPMSLAVSRYLARWHISPNTITTGVFLMTLVGALFAASTSVWALVIAGLIFQIASVLDGCDGEVSRLAYRGTRYGAWYDTISDNIRYMIFFAALGVSAYRSSHSEVYLWAVGGFILVATFFCVSMARFTSTQEHLTNLAVTEKLVSQQRTKLWERFMLPLEGLVKQDVSAFAAMICCFLAVPQVFFWVGCLALVIMTVSLIRGFASDGEFDLQEARLFIAYMVGVGVLGFLVSRMPLGSLQESLKGIGSSVLLVFAVTPVWYAANARCLGRLIENRLSFGQLMYTQVVGEAYNAVLPLAGLGGEPFKIRYLSQTMPVADASHVVVRDRLLHALSGLVFTGVLIVATLSLIAMPRAAQLSLGIVAGACLAAAVIFTLVVFSRLPGKFTERILRRFSGLRRVAYAPMAKSTFFVCLSYKLVGRAALNFSEMWIILQLLGLPAGPEQVVAVTALLTTTSTVFFIMPQGLGVNELGIAGAFQLLGMSTFLGITVGLVRRARVIFWALVGLSIHLAIAGLHRIRRFAQSATE